MAKTITVNEKLFYSLMHLPPKMRSWMAAEHGEGRYERPNLYGTNGYHEHDERRRHRDEPHDTTGRGVVFVRERVLVVLANRDEGLRQKEIAEEIRVNPSSMSELIDKLENDGYVERTLDPSDKRATRIVLTEKGRVRAHELEDGRNERLNKMFRSLTEDEKGELVRLLDKLMDKGNHLSGKENLLEKRDISELISGYFLCWDTRKFDLDSMGEIFTKDAQIKLPPTEVIIGLPAISELHIALSEQFESTHHMTSDVLCNFTSENSASVRCNLSAYHLYTADKRQEKGADFLIVRCVVECSVLRDGEKWRISRLNVKSIYRFLK